MSISNSYPTQRPTLNLDFANSGKLDSRISYARSSTGTALSSERHLSSENLLLQSQAFDTSWGRDASLNAPTGNQTAPDGTSTAWLLTTAASGTGKPFLFQNPAGAVANNTVCTYVMHIKAGTASHAYISFRGQSSSAAAWALIDFASPTSPTTGGSLSSISATSVSLGNSWYRVALTFDTGTISSGYPYVYVGASDGTSPDSTGRVTWTYSGETIFAWGAQLSSTNSKVYDSPTTTQRHREYAPTLKTFAADEPRFEYTADGESEGLLIEASATNLQRYGSDFASWSYGSAINRYSNQAIAPNGMLEADLLVGTDATSLHYFLDAVINFTAGLKYTMSVYFKDAGQRYVQLSALTALQGSGAVNFDLQSGTLSASGAHTGTLESVGNGWYRATVTITAAATVTSGFAIQSVDSLSSSRSSTSVCDGYSGWLAWGAQIETGSSASSLVDTGTGSSQLTRSADSCSVADFGYTGGPVSITAEANTSDVSSASKIIFRLNGGDVYTNYFQGALLVNYVTAGGATQALQYPSSVAAGTDYKVASRVDTNSINSAANGTAQTADTTAVLPDLAGATLYIGGISGSQCLNGNLKNLKVFSAPLSDTNLTAITS